MRENLRQTSYRLALCAVLAALGTVLMGVGGLIPIATYATPLYTQLLLIPALQEFGRREGWMVWAVTAALSLMLSADREAAVFYLLLGNYPMLKPAFDKIRHKMLNKSVKFIYFTFIQALLYAALIWVFGMQEVLSALREAALVMNVLTIAMLSGILLFYDRLLERMVPFYLHKIRPKLPRLGQKH